MADPVVTTTLFSDAQVGILVAALTAMGGTVAATLRWAVNRVTKALDDNSQVHRDVAVANVEHAKAMTTLSVKIDHVTEWVEEHTPPVVTLPDLPSHRRTVSETGPTPQGGYGPYRPPTHRPKDKP